MLADAAAAPLGAAWGIRGMLHRRFFKDGGEWILLEWGKALQIALVAVAVRA